MEGKLGFYRTDCEQLFSHLNHQDKQFKLKRRWLMGLPLSKNKQKKMMKHKFLPESLLREDDVFCETVKTCVEKTHGAESAERERHTTQEAEQLFDRRKMRRFLLSSLDALTNEALLSIATLLTKSSLNIGKTRHKMKKVIKESIQDVLGGQNHDHEQVELFERLSQLLNDPQNVRENCLTRFVPTYQSHHDAAVKILENLEDLPFEALLAMRRKLRGVPAGILKMQQEKRGMSRGNLIRKIRRISEKMLPELHSRDELQPPLAKALAVAGLSLKLKQGWTGSSVTEFYQFSPEIKSLQNEIAKAIWSIGESRKVRMKELKKLKLLLDPTADVSNASLRTALKKMLTEYLYECSNLASIPMSLSKALLIINGNYRRTHLNEEIEEEVDCILSVSAQTKQIVWDLLPEHDFDEDYCDAYMEELEESDDGGGDAGGGQYHDDDASAISLAANDNEDIRVNFSSRYDSFDIDQPEESIGERMSVDFKPPPCTPDRSCSRLFKETKDFHDSSHLSTNYFEVESSIRLGASSHIGTFSSPIPLQSGSLSGTRIKVESEQDNVMDSVNRPYIPTSKFKFEEEGLADKKKPCNNLYLRIQEVADGVSMVAYNVIGHAMEGFAREEGLDLDLSCSSYLRSDCSDKKNLEDKQIPSETNASGSVIVQVVEELIPSLPKSAIEKVKKLMDL